MKTRLPAYGALVAVAALSGIVIAGGGEPAPLDANSPGAQRPNSIFSWGDYDGDGLDDAYVIVEGGHGGLLLNQGDGTLRDVSAESGLGEVKFPRFALWHDFDLDGHNDLFVGTPKGKSHLFRNLGNSTFEDVGPELGLDHQGDDRRAHWLDYDADGWADLHVRTGTQDILYHNLGGRNFEAVELGLASALAPVVASNAPATNPDESDQNPDTSTGVRPTDVGPGAPLPADTAPSPRTFRDGRRGLDSSARTRRDVVDAPSVAGGTICADGIVDQSNLANCILASSVPTQGHLYPLSNNLFVVTSGEVVVNGKLPRNESRLTVNGDYAASGNGAVAVSIKGIDPPLGFTGGSGLDIQAGGGTGGGIGAVIRGGDTNGGNAGDGVQAHGGYAPSFVGYGRAGHGLVGRGGTGVEAGIGVVAYGGSGLQTDDPYGYYEATGGVGLKAVGGEPDGQGGGFRGGAGAQVTGGYGAAGIVATGGDGSYYPGGVGALIQGGYNNYDGAAGAKITGGDGGLGIGGTGVASYGAYGSSGGFGIFTKGGAGLFGGGTGLLARGGEASGTYGVETGGDGLHAYGASGLQGGVGARIHGGGGYGSGQGGTGIVVQGGGGYGGGVGAIITGGFADEAGDNARPHGAIITGNEGGFGPGGHGVIAQGGTGFGGIGDGLVATGGEANEILSVGGIGVHGIGGSEGDYAGVRGTGVLGEGKIGVHARSTDGSQGTALFSEGGVLVQNEQSAIVTIEADTDDVNEFDNARIEFSQDGGDRTAHVGYKAEANGDNRFQIFATGGVGPVSIGTNSQERMRVTHAGRVGIGTATPSFLLEVRGTAGKPGGGAWSNASDLRLKKNVADLEDALETLLELRGVTYEYKDPEGIGELAGERIGFIAQEVENVLPDWVEEGEDGFKRLTVRGFEALAVEALRELRAENLALRAEVERQSREIGASLSLRARVERLEALLSQPAEDR